MSKYTNGPSPRRTARDPAKRIAPFKKDVAIGSDDRVSDAGHVPTEPATNLAQVQEGLYFLCVREHGEIESSKALVGFPEFLTQLSSNFVGQV